MALILYVPATVAVEPNTMADSVEFIWRYSTKVSVTTDWLTGIWKSRTRFRFVEALTGTFPVTQMALPPAESLTTGLWNPAEILEETEGAEEAEDGAEEVEEDAREAEETDDAVEPDEIGEDAREGEKAEEDAREAEETFDATEEPTRLVMFSAKLRKLMMIAAKLKRLMVVHVPRTLTRLMMIHIWRALRTMMMLQKMLMMMLPKEVRTIHGVHGEDTQREPRARHLQAKQKTKVQAQSTS